MAAARTADVETSADYARGLARACGGALLFALPLLMTMEMWSLGFEMARAVAESGARVYMTARGAEQLEASAAEHLALIDALLAGKADRAEKLMRAHVRRQRDRAHIHRAAGPDGGAPLLAVGRVARKHWAARMDGGGNVPKLLHGT